MHLYMMTRGINDRTKKWINDLCARSYPHKIKMPDGTERMAILQLAVRPIQLWELAFPEPCKDDVIRSIFPTNSEARAFTLKNYKWMKWLAQSVLQCDEKLVLPNLKQGEIVDRYNGALFNDWVERIPIGLKKDQYIDGYEQI